MCAKSDLNRPLCFLGSTLSPLIDGSLPWEFGFDLLGLCKQSSKRFNLSSQRLSNLFQSRKYSHRCFFILLNYATFSLEIYFIELLNVKVGSDVFFSIWIWIWTFCARKEKPFLISKFGLKPNKHPEFLCKTLTTNNIWVHTTPFSFHARQKKALQILKLRRYG